MRFRVFDFDVHEMLGESEEAYAGDNGYRVIPWNDAFAGLVIAD